MHRTKFSVVIPTYNRKDFVVKSIQSVLNQNYQNAEIVVVDDGSNDGTKEHIRAIFGKEPRVKYYYKINEERAVARNYGASKSQGDYVIFLDSDDLMLQNCLQNYAKIISDYGPEVLFSNYNFLMDGKSKNSNVHLWKEGWYSWTKFLKGNYFASMICFKKQEDGIVVPENKEVLTSEDWLFNILKTYKKNFYYISMLGFTMVEHDGRSMNQNQGKIIQTKLNALAFIKDQIDFDKEEQKLLNGHAYFFAAIHSYVGNFKKSAITYIFRSAKVPFLRKATLFIKVIIGRKNLLRLKDKFA